jgi:hypothetical protein
MDQQLVIKLSETTGKPIGLVENPPMLYSNFKLVFRPNVFSDTATATEVESHGYGVFEWAWAPRDLPYTQSVDDVGLTLHTDNIWRPTFIERPATNHEIVERTNREKENVREYRNDLLRRTDYTQLPDSKLSLEKIAEFKLYRQKLRDIPLQEGFPWAVEYPTIPINR